MKKKKNERSKLMSFIALLLSFVMVLSLTAACEESDGESADLEKSEEVDFSQGVPVDYFAGTELTIAFVRNAMDLSESFEEKPIVKMAEEATGIHINWMEIENSAGEERVNAILSSDELPDAFMNAFGKEVLIENAELFYDLSKDGLLETYAPDVLESYENGGQGVKNLLIHTDGSIRSLAGDTAASWDSDNGAYFWLNKVWLEELGLDEPTNIDELFDVLCAFRDGDPNKNGEKDEIAVSFCDETWMGKFMSYANLWGIAGTESGDITSYYYMLEDGKLVPTVDTDEYRAFLEFFHKLKVEGLLDVEGFSQTNDQYTAKVSDGRVGLFLEWDPMCVGGNNDDYIQMQLFPGMEGVTVRKSGCEGFAYVNLTAFVPSASTSNIEALLHWWNWIHSSYENKLYSRFGSDGYNWIKEEDGTVRQRTLEDSVPEGVDFTEKLYTESFYQSGAYLSPKDYDDTNDETYVRHQYKDRVESYKWQEGEYINRSKIIDLDVSEEISFMEIDLFPVITGFLATSVVEGVTDESWNAYLEDLKAYGYYEWLTLMQDAYVG